MSLNRPFQYKIILNGRTFLFYICLICSRDGYIHNHWIVNSIRSLNLWSKIKQWISGIPKTPVFQSNLLSKMSNSHTLTWITESYSPVTEYRVIYRKISVSPSFSLAFTIVIVFVGRQGERYTLRLDQFKPKIWPERWSHLQQDIHSG